MGVATAYVAKQRGRDPIAWFVVGLLLGLIGLIIVFLLPVSNEDETGQSDQKDRKPSLPTSATPAISQNPLPNGYLYKQWFFLTVDREQKGPLAFDELKEEWLRGSIKNDSYVWCEEMLEWHTVEELKLFENSL